MASITDIVLGNIDGISQEYARNIAEPSRILQQIGVKIREDGELICAFERKELDAGVSMVAIDGGNASEQLAGGDLIVAGATLGEGINSKPIYGDSSAYPSEVFSTIIPHTSNNEKIEKTIRALLELRILADTPADVRIIDGAYIGNVSAVLYALIDKDPAVSNALLEYGFYDSDGLLKKAMQEILYPPRGTDNGIIAVPKSDSSKMYINHTLEKYDLKNFGITDRILATRLLKPGEFFAPRNITSNPGLIASLTKLIGSEGFGEKSSNRALLMSLVQDKAGLIRRLSTEPTEEGLLWTTYFKPTAWNDHSRVIKIEFLFYASESTLSVEEKARELIQIVDQDIVEETIQEPWCQYAADRGAKEVSHAMNILKSHILNMVATPEEAAGILTGYRT